MQVSKQSTQRVESPTKSSPAPAGQYKDRDGNPVTFQQFTKLLGQELAENLNCNVMAKLAAKAKIGT